MVLGTFVLRLMCKMVFYKYELEKYMRNLIMGVPFVVDITCSFYTVNYIDSDIFMSINKK